MKIGWKKSLKGLVGKNQGDLGIYKNLEFKVCMDVDGVGGMLQVIKFGEILWRLGKRMKNF